MKTELMKEWEDINNGEIPEDFDDTIMSYILELETMIYSREKRIKELEATIMRGLIKDAQVKRASREEGERMNNDFIKCYELLESCVCGSKNLLIRTDDEGKFYIHCHSCKKETIKSYKTRLEAVEEWNRKEG